jgi:hypothetical protein
MTVEKDLLKEAREFGQQMKDDAKKWEEEMRELESRLGPDEEKQKRIQQEDARRKQDEAARHLEQERLAAAESKARRIEQEEREKPRNVSDEQLKKLFGKGSDAHAANLLAKENLKRYRELKREAQARGLF